MEKQMFKRGMVKTVFEIILLSLSVLFFGFLTFSFGKTIFVGTDILESKTFGDYVYMKVKYLSSSFGGNDSGSFHFASVKNANGKLNDFILYLPVDVAERDDVKTLIEKSYEAGADDLAPLRLNGYVEKSFDELDEAADEAYKIYTGLEESESAADYLGNYYVAYTSASPMSSVDFNTWMGFVLCVAILIGSVINIVQAVSRQTRLSAKIKHAQELYASNPDYQQGMEQVKQPSAMFYKNCQCYVTDDYVVTYQDGPEVFRIDQIQELYGYDNSQYKALTAILFGVVAGNRTVHQLVAITADGEVHTFAAQGMRLTVHQQIVTQLLTRNPSIRLGREGKTAQELGLDLSNLNLVKVVGFYGSNKPWQGRTLNTFSIE